MLYEMAVDYLDNIPEFRTWPEFLSLFRRTAELKPRHWQLPFKICQAVGGNMEQALPAVVAFACAQISILLIDDMLDQDPRGEYLRIGPALAANFSATFQAAGLEAVFTGLLPASNRFFGSRSLNSMYLKVASGQYLDVQNLTAESKYWQVVESKSGAFFGTAFYLGALSGGASDSLAARLERIGHLYGQMIQIHDDLNDSMSIPASPDWLQDRSPLPILYARLVQYPERGRFLKLCEQIPDPNALLEAQEILIRSGAVSYCIHQVFLRHRLARKILRAILLVNRGEIDALLDAMTEPVAGLLKKTE